MWIIPGDPSLLYGFLHHTLPHVDSFHLQKKIQMNAHQIWSQSKPALQRSDMQYKYTEPLFDCQQSTIAIFPESDIEDRSLCCRLSVMMKVIGLPCLRIDINKRAMAKMSELEVHLSHSCLPRIPSHPGCRQRAAAGRGWNSADCSPHSRCQHSCCTAAGSCCCHTLAAPRSPRSPAAASWSGLLHHSLQAPASKLGVSAQNLLHATSLTLWHQQDRPGHTFLTAWHTWTTI